VKVVLLWKNCGLFKKKQDGYWVQCPSSELEDKILPQLSKEVRKQFLERKEHFLSTVWATKNPDLLVEPSSYYFMVSKDGKEIQPTDPYFPYSSQWNAYNPFESTTIKKIDSLSDI
jgi:hypothetical protein